MKPIIKLEINLPEFTKYVKYHDWQDTREYLQTFLDDALLNIKVSLENKQVLNDVIKFDDSKRIR